MATCEVCGNDYDKAFQVTVAGATHTFDSFECAIPDGARSDTARGGSADRQPFDHRPPSSAMAFCKSGSGKTKPVMARSAMVSDDTA